jgi:hypothetical protein
MSKLGVHVSNGNRRGFGEFLQTCANAGSPVPVVFSVDQDVWPDVEKFSPQTVVVFRHQNRDPHTGGQDGPGDTYVGDPIKSAQRWMAANMPAWRRNRAHYYAPINEQDAGVLAGYTWLNDFSLECLRIADANGFKLALYGFSGGNPRDGATDLDRSTLEDKWRELVPSLQFAKQHGHILLLHEYGFGSEPANGGRRTSLRASAPNLALRYRRSYRWLARFEADPPLVISESGAGVGGFGELGQAAWLADAIWYDQELMRDRIVIGCCLYQVGGDENIRNVLPALGAYVAAASTPAPESGSLPVIAEVGGPDPIEPPVDPIEPPVEPIEPPVDPIEPPIETPATPVGPLDFDVRLTRCRRDPDAEPAQKRLILTFEITVTGGAAPYTYVCEGQPLSGPVRERPARRQGAVIESYTVTDATGQSKQRKFFFSASEFPC